MFPRDKILSIAHVPYAQKDARQLGVLHRPDADWADFLKQHLFAPPSREQVERAIYAPVAGINWQQRLDVLSHKITNMDRLAGILATGASSGMSQAELKRQIQPVVQNISSSAARIARTEGLRIATSAQREQYAELGDMLAGVQIVATLDENTRPSHAARNGRIYWADRRKKPTIDELPLLPDEPNCRCYDTPVLHPPEEFENDPALRDEFMNAAGNSIPDPQVYGQWFDRADPGRRKQAVGVRRYDAVVKRLGSSRPPRFEDFIGDDGALLPISHLRNESDEDRLKRIMNVQSQMRERQVLLQKVSRFGFVSKKDFVVDLRTSELSRGPVSAEFGAGVSASFTATVADTLNALPSKVHEILKRGKQKVNAAEFLTDVRPELRGERPRGWPSGSTWDEVDGAHNSQYRQIIVAEKTRISSGEVELSQRTVGVLRHEIGHAIDQSLKNFSKTKAFRSAYQKDIAQIGKSADHQHLAEQLHYFLQSGDAGPSEAFAESCAIILGGSSISSRSVSFKALFPESLAVIQGRIQ